MINEMIRSKEVRVIDHEGEQVGILPIAEALIMASENDLDLVEVAPDSKPPVCKIMDYGRYKYAQSKRAHEAKKKQTIVHVKEVKLRPRTVEHDMVFKIRNVLKFLNQGDKVKVSMFFRGREIVHKELGRRLLDRVKEEVNEVGVVEQQPKSEGRSMIMIIAPLNKPVQNKEKGSKRQENLQ